MATTRNNANNMQSQVGSPRPKGRENKDTLCRNVVIYGHCRYEDQGCAFNHDQNKNNSNQTDLSGKKALNVDSPAFTPSTQQQTAKKSTFSSQAASAAPFTPRGASATPSLQQNVEAPVFNPATVREFTPQNYDLANSASQNSAAQDTTYSTDHFTLGSMAQALPSTPYNPYAGEHSGIANAGATYFQSHGGFGTPLQPPQYHLYAPIGPYREELLPYQRAASEFFLSDTLREELQKKAHATLQVMPNTALPQLDRYHSLFPLDTSNRKNTTIFGFPSWVFKATSSKNGKYYCLRRIEGYRLTSEHAIHAAKEWKTIVNANIVRFHEAFTSREFGDSSLIFCHDYHPLSKTLAEHHFPAVPANRYRTAPTAVPENVLWGYICQIANALRSIHSAKLAARCVELSKIILTDKNRIRLAACSILDVVQYEPNPRPIAEFQQEDFVQFGKVMLSLATSTLPVHINNVSAAVESLSAKYSDGLKDVIAWLVSAPKPGDNSKNIDNFMRGITAHMVQYSDLALQAADGITSDLYREVENGRLVRLLCKLGTINERGEFAGDPNWSEHGERYPLKLFRDYVFHQVDQDGNPRLNLGHMMACMNKLDAASEERVYLTSRDGQDAFILTFKELKQMIERAFNELAKQSKQGAPGA